MKQSIRSVQLTVYGLAMACLILVGCAQLGVAPALKLEDRVYAAATTANEVTKTATTLLKLKRISDNDAENVLKTVDAATAGLAVVRLYGKTDPAVADAKLQAVLASLTAMQAYLAAQGAK